MTLNNYIDTSVQKCGVPCLFQWDQSASYNKQVHISRHNDWLHYFGHSIVHGNTQDYEIRRERNQRTKKQAAASENHKAEVSWKI